MLERPASRPHLAPWRLATLLSLLLPLVGCGGDGGGRDTVVDEDVIVHLDGPGCEETVRYARPRASGVGAPERALLGMRRVPVADAFEASLCSDFCHEAERCGDDFGGRTACLAQCAERLADGRGNGVACYASDCRQRVRCLESGRVEAVTGCPELCTALTRCPALAILGLTPEASACGTLCAGRAVAFPTFADAVPCLANAAAACDLDEALACLPHGRAFCPSLCLEVEACPAGSPLATVWPSREACFAECDAKTPVMALKAQACFERLGCDADRVCLDQTPPLCEAYFAEAERACGAEGSWPASFELLGLTCDEAQLAAVEHTDEVAACLTARGSCDDLESRVCPSLARADQTALCTRICTAMCDCGLMTEADCLGLCEEADPGDAELDTLATCVAERDCAVLEACTDETLVGSPLATPAAGDDPCDRYCRAVAECGDGSPVPGCLTGCAAALDAGDAGPLAAIGCHEAGGCAAFATCDAAPPSSSACASACDGADRACGQVLAGFDAGLASCSAYCAGLLTTWGRDDATTAACVVGATDARCVLPAVAGCAP